MGEEAKVQTNQDTQLELEYNRHRDHLERSLASMKQKVEYEQHTHAVDTTKMIKENTALIREINDVRKEVGKIELEKTGTDKVKLPALKFV